MKLEDMGCGQCRRDLEWLTPLKSNLITLGDIVEEYERDLDRISACPIHDLDTKQDLASALKYYNDKEHR